MALMPRGSRSQNPCRANLPAVIALSVDEETHQLVTEHGLEFPVG